MKNEKLEALKKAVLLKKLQALRLPQGDSRRESSPIPRVSREQPLVLSLAQQRLWFLDQLDHAASAAYHMPAALRLQGRLDRGALRAALDRIVARHEILRTHFVTHEGQACQQIGAADVGFGLLEHDVRHLSGHEQEATVAL